MTNDHANLAFELRRLEEQINATLREATAAGLKVLITVKPETDDVRHPTVHFDAT